MAHSVREQILQAMAAVLVPVANANGAQFYRSPVTGIPREQSPALLLFPESDALVERRNDRVSRALTVRLVALARESAGEIPEVIADQLLVASHAALFSARNLGGLCIGINELDTDWDVEDADAIAAAIPARYRIDYLTLETDLSIQG